MLLCSLCSEGLSLVRVAVLPCVLLVNQDLALAVLLLHRRHLGLDSDLCAHKVGVGHRLGVVAIGWNDLAGEALSRDGR